MAKSAVVWLRGLWRGYECCGVAKRAVAWLRVQCRGQEGCGEAKTGYDVAE